MNFQAQQFYQDLKMLKNIEGFERISHWLLKYCTLNNSGNKPRVYNLVEDVILRISTDPRIFWTSAESLSSDLMIFEERSELIGQALSPYIFKRSGSQLHYIKPEWLTYFEFITQYERDNLDLMSYGNGVDAYVNMGRLINHMISKINSPASAERPIILFEIPKDFGDYDGFTDNELLFLTFFLANNPVDPQLEPQDVIPLVIFII